MENHDLYRKIEENFCVKLAYYHGGEQFLMINGGNNIPLEHLSYQRYPKAEGCYVLTKCTCENLACDVGNPDPNCKVYSKQKCAVWEYDDLNSYRLRVDGIDIIQLYKEIEELKKANR